MNLEDPCLTRIRARPAFLPTGELQWNVLIAATLAISAFVMVDSGSGDDDSGIPLMGVARSPRPDMSRVETCSDRRERLGVTGM